MKTAIAIALAMMTLATQAEVKKAVVKKSAQQQKAEEKRADLRKKAEENSKPKVAEEPTDNPSQNSKHFTSMRQGETAKIETESVRIVQITGTNTATVIFAWAGNAKQKVVLTGVPTLGLYNEMDIKMPYALTIDGTQTYKTAKGLVAALPVVRPATKDEAIKKGFAEHEIHP